MVLLEMSYHPDKLSDTEKCNYHDRSEMSYFLLIVILPLHAKFVLRDVIITDIELSYWRCRYLTLH